MGWFSSNFQAGNWTEADWWQSVAGGFPTQYAGLRAYYGGAVHTLCLVAVADAEGGLMLSKNGTSYNVYLVETSDPNASPLRISTGGGTKAVRVGT